LRTKANLRWTALLAVLLIATLLGACGGNSEPAAPTNTPAPMPTRVASPATPTAAASPVVSPAASPIVPTIGSPVSDGTPASLTAAASTMTREEFKAALQSAFPFETGASQGGSIVFGSPGDISTTNPLLMSDLTTFNILSQVFEPLIGASPIDGRPIPALADSWTVSDDGLTYTFKMNTDAKWHDGVDVTAEDVAFSYDAALDPNLNSPYRTQLREVIASYRVVDPDTFEITATDRFASFLYNAPASVFILAKHIWGAVPVEQWSFDGGSTGEDLSRVIGTGPFLFKAWEPGQRLTLAKNPNHYDTVPNIDEFVMVVILETDTLVRSLESGDIDLVEILPPHDTERIQNSGGLAVSIYNFYQMTYYVLNVDGQRVPAFSDQRVRQALYQAVDRQTLTDTLFAGFGEPAVGTHPPLSPAYAPDQMPSTYPYDPEAAKSLLREAGWDDSLKVSILYVGGDATVDGMLAFLQESWNEIGVDVDLENISGEVLQERLYDGDFDMALTVVNLTPEGSQGLLFNCDAATNGFNYGRYCNVEYDALDERQLREFDPALRVQQQIQLQQMVWADLPIGPIRFGEARTGYSMRIHNFFPNGYGFLWSLPFVWVESGS
jgi:peptide/nickel transport system substrate-binding protein